MTSMTAEARQATADQTHRGFWGLTLAAITYGRAHRHPSGAPIDEAEGVAVQMALATLAGAHPPHGFKIGATGRATGPHLHWSIKWREARLDPLLFVGEMKA